MSPHHDHSGDIKGTIANVDEDPDTSFICRQVLAQEVSRNANSLFTKIDPRVRAALAASLCCSLRGITNDASLGVISHCRRTDVDLERNGIPVRIGLACVEGSFLVGCSHIVEQGSEEVFE